MNHLLFELHEISTGRTFRLWYDGKIEGFAEDTMILNYAAPFINALLGSLIKAKALAEESARSAGRGLEVADEPPPGRDTIPLQELHEQYVQALAKNKA